MTGIAKYLMDLSMWTVLIYAYLGAFAVAILSVYIEKKVNPHYFWYVEAILMIIYLSFLIDLLLTTKR